MEKERLVDLSELNKAQADAVKDINGASLIIAGAGSGKTRVLTYKIAYLLENGIAPENILALTFTNKAAKEMKERISNIVGRSKAARLWSGTFHSIFMRFLRQYAELIKFPSSFTIYDASDSRNAIKACIKELQLDEKIYKPSEVASRISLAKNNLVTATAYASNSTAIQNDAACKKPRICDIYALYARKCFASGVMDFDDILLYMNVLFRDYPDVCRELAGQFKYILVDEYQDTNMAQYLIIKKLAAINGNISVVGDDAQSIYGFRGARIQNILNFKKDFPAAREYRLEQNYRSTQTIVNAANSVISKNEKRLKKECFSQGDTGEKINVIKAFTEQDEAEQIASSIISRIHTDKASYDQFAILYRANSQSRTIEESLRKRNLPYRIYAGHSFYERAEVKDVLAYLRLLVNKRDDEAFRRIINVPARGIGATSMDALTAAAKENSLSLWEALSLPDLERYGLKQAARNRMNDFVKMMESFSEKVDNTDAYTLALEVVNISGYMPSLVSDTSIESLSRQENVKELLDSISMFVEEETKSAAEAGEENIFVSLSRFIENVALLTDSDGEDDSEDNNKIRLMTVHSSKGLEFPYIYIIGMEENIFPSSSSLMSMDDIEEERRLFYVALTRAMKAVTISYSRSRFRWGQHVNYPPSRFISKDIDQKYLKTPVWAEESEEDDDDDFIGFKRNNGFARTGNTAPNTNRQIISPAAGLTKIQHRMTDSFSPSPVSEIQKGMTVEHGKFGRGTVMELEGSGPDAKAKVDFENGGIKVLLLKYARLRISD